jgi:predicted anti-sigma-YlaC factor YlaD
MNCQSCQKEFDSYREGTLPAYMKTQVETHLKACEKCAGIYQLQTLAERVIIQEKEILSNPFLAARILTRIEDLETSGYKTIPVFRRLIKPALITVSLAAAIVYGVIIGNIYQPLRAKETVPVELALIDDATIESVNLLSNE